jgi:hypothetical protein
MSEYIVPLGFAAIGAVIISKVLHGCECKPKSGVRVEFTQEYPQHWRSRVGHRAPVPLAHNWDDGSALLTQRITIDRVNGVQIPAEYSIGPSLHPGMLNPSSGRPYELHQHHLHVQKMANKVPVAKRQTGFKKRAADIREFY